MKHIVAGIIAALFASLVVLGNASAQDQNDIFMDGRLNRDAAAAVIVYCEGGDFTFYPAVGGGSARVRLVEVARGLALAQQTGSNILLANSLGIQVQVSPSGQLTATAADPNDGHPYSFSTSVETCGSLTDALAPVATPLPTTKPYHYNPYYYYYPSYIYHPPTNPTSVPVSGDTYVVQRGDNLFRISLRFGVDLNTLARANNIADPTRIYAGQVLVIPQG